MKVTTIATGSQDGNCYIVTSNNGESVVLDAGVKFEKVTHHPEFPKFKTISFVFVGHCHNDHSLSLVNFRRAGCEMLTYETLIPEVQHHKIGDWDITTFPLAHNVDNWGIILKHNITGEKLCYMTDFYKAPMIENCETFIYEVNYIDALIDEMIEQDKELKHTNFKFHNSLENAIEYFSTMKSRPKSIYCCHGSKNHSVKQRIYEGMKQFADEVVVL